MARSFGQHEYLGAIGWAISVLEALERPPPSELHESDMASLRAAIERLLGRAKIRREDELLEVDGDRRDRRDRRRVERPGAPTRMCVSTCVMFGPVLACVAEETCSG